MLVRWRDLDVDKATWEPWAKLRGLPGAAAAWRRYDDAERNLPPPPLAPLERERALAREFRPLGSYGGLRGGRELRPYQLAGVNWLLANWHARRSCVLADEMGLGKTAQLLLFLGWLCEHRGVGGPFLVIAPLSTLGHWEREVGAWTGMGVATVHGPRAARDLVLQHTIRHADARGRPTGRLRVHVVLTTYEHLVTEQSALSALDWECVVVDEAHRLKNPATRLAAAVGALRASHTVLLTGTPVQNNVPELLALMKWVDGDAFGAARGADLAARFGEVTRPEQVEELQRLIRPFMLRRTKAELEDPLPPKRETLLKVELMPAQKRVYRAILDRAVEHIKNPRSSLRNVFMQLRKACDHSMLLEAGAAEEAAVEDALEAADEAVRAAEGGGGGGGAAEGARAARVEAGVKELRDGSGKMVLLDKLLPKLKRLGHKVLLFSQFAMLLDLLEDYLTLRRPMLGGYRRVDGTVGGAARQSAIDAFQSDDDCFVFLLTTRAGGQGINLTAADVVIIYDSDWNPQGDLQGQARAHRIGQTREVTVYRLVTNGTYEQRLYERARQKLSLDPRSSPMAAAAAARAAAAAAAAAAR